MSVSDIDVIEPWCAIGTATITASLGLHCRDRPSSDGKILITLPLGKEVILWGKNGPWFLVQDISHDGVCGWCHGDWLDLSKAVLS